MCTFSMLHLSGMTSIQRYPFTAAAMARAVPVQRGRRHRTHSQWHYCTPPPHPLFGDTEHSHSGTTVHHHPIHSSNPPPLTHTHTQAQNVSNRVCEPDYKELDVSTSSRQSSQSEPGSVSTSYFRVKVLFYSGFLLGL